jgi:hypothetical protein
VCSLGPAGCCLTYLSDRPTGSWSDSRVTMEGLCAEPGCVGCKHKAERTGNRDSIDSNVAGEAQAYEIKKVPFPRAE